jgi:hypothetical protein
MRPWHEGLFAGRAGQRYGVFAPGIDWAALALGTIASRDVSAADPVASRCRSAAPRKS